MIQINRKISLEPFKSRLPGIIPAIMNNELYTFGNALIARQNAYPSNYGMCPCSIVIPNDLAKNISYKIYNRIENSQWDYNSGSEMIVSYRRLVTWYHFFENYYHFLMDYGSCGKIYTSATQYYDCETQGNSSANLYYQGGREFYQGLDEKFHNLGGSFDKKTTNNGCEEYLIDLNDTGLYKWICTNCIPRFIIPKRLRDEWNATHIFYPDAIKWVGWFAKRIDVYKDYKSIDDCKNASNCCDCEKFFRLGGIDMYNLLSDFVKRTREIANKWSTSGELKYIEEASTIRTQISLQINVDDMGEMSPMEEEWEGGIDYGNGKENGGAIVRYKDDVYMLDSKKKAKPEEINGRLQYGYKFDEQFLEFKFGNEDANRYKNDKFVLDNKKHWIDYTDYYIGKHSKEFNPSSEYFGFNENGQKVSLDDNNIDSDGNKKAMSISYGIERNGNLGYILIDDLTYEIFEQEYITYQSNGKNPYLDNHIFLVERYPVTNVPYVVINKMTYISKDRKTFPFYKPEDGSNVPFKTGKFIYYKDILYKVDEDANNIIIGYDDYQYEYPHIDGSLTYGNKTYYAVGNALYTSSIDTNNDTNYVKTELVKADDQEWGYDLDTSKHIVNIYPKKYTIYNAHYLEGKTESKLLDLQSNERTYDDLGNPLDGYYNFNNQNQKYAQPPEGTFLEPLYQVGTVKNLTPIESITNGDKKYFYGDILYNMSFYYVDDDGNKVDKDGTSCTIDWDIEIEKKESVRKTTLGVITSCKNKKKEIQSKYNDEYDEATKLDDEGKKLKEVVNKYQSFQDDIMCDVTYYMGATLEYVDGKGYVLAEGYNSGITYKETVAFKEMPQKYYLKEDDFYMVNVIVPEREQDTIYSNTYDLQYNDNIASIKMKIDILGSNDDEFINGFAHNNNTIIEPVIRQEYKFGISSLQSVDSDIYIDRGINAAFEKHLKLGEVSTMEDLVQYSNGFFKIMDS